MSNVVEEIKHHRQVVRDKILRGECRTYDDYLAKCAVLQNLTACENYITRSIEEVDDEGFHHG